MRIKAFDAIVFTTLLHCVLAYIIVHHHIRFVFSLFDFLCIYLYMHNLIILLTFGLHSFIHSFIYSFDVVVHISSCYSTYLCTSRFSVCFSFSNRWIPSSVHLHTVSLLIGWAGMYVALCLCLCL